MSLRTHRPSRPAPARVVSGRSDRPRRIDRIVQSRRSVEHDVQRRRLDRVESASGLRSDRGPAARYVSGIGHDVLHEPVAWSLCQGIGSEPMSGSAPAGRSRSSRRAMPASSDERSSRRPRGRQRDEGCRKRRTPIRQVEGSRPARSRAHGLVVHLGCGQARLVPADVRACGLPR